MSDQEKTSENIAKFAWRLKALAERCGLSQADIARALGVHWSVVGNWFQGRNLPRKEYRLALAALLKSDVDHLYQGQEPTDPIEKSLGVRRAISVEERRQLNLDAHVASGPVAGVAVLRRAIFEELDRVLESASNDPVRLAWVLEQLRLHVRAPAHWVEEKIPPQGSLYMQTHITPKTNG